MFLLYHFFAYNSIKIQDFFEIYRARILKRISIIFLPDFRHPSPSPLPSHPPPKELCLLPSIFLKIDIRPHSHKYIAAESFTLQHLSFYGNTKKRQKEPPQSCGGSFKTHYCVTYLLFRCSRNTSCAARRRLLPAGAKLPMHVSQ